jgi:uncharacterized protein (DUF1330 family)
VAAYVIVDVVVKDPVRYDDYRKRVMATLEPYNGRFLVRGGKVEALEGTWKPQRFVILEFPDAAAARAWWNSEAYAEPKAIRLSASHTEMILVEGI